MKKLILVVVFAGVIVAMVYLRGALNSPAALVPPPSKAAPATVPQAETPAPAPVAGQPDPAEQSPVAPQAAAAPAADVPITAETLRNTTWEKGDFRVDLAADGSVYFGGIKRAKWMVEGDRVKLYNDNSDEVHYFDIKGSKLFWEGEEIGKSSAPFQPSAPFKPESFPLKSKTLGPSS
jgi:hypothetical protein